MYVCEMLWKVEGRILIFQRKGGTLRRKLRIGFKDIKEASGLQLTAHAFVIT